MIEGLKDKVVIVTGGAHGIGKAYCLGFAQAGAHVVIADIDKPPPSAAAPRSPTISARQRWHCTPTFRTKRRLRKWPRAPSNVSAGSTC